MIRSLKALGFKAYEMDSYGKVYMKERILENGKTISKRLLVRMHNGMVTLKKGERRQTLKAIYLYRYVFDRCPKKGPLTLPTEKWVYYGDYRISSLGRVMDPEWELQTSNTKGSIILRFNSGSTLFTKENIIELYNKHTANNNHKSE